MNEFKRLLAPRFLITVLVILSATILLAIGQLSASEWLTATLGAGGVYTLGSSPERDQKKELDP